MPVAACENDATPRHFYSNASPPDIADARVNSRPTEPRCVVHLKAEMSLHISSLVQLPRTLGNMLCSPLEVKLWKDKAFVSKQDVETSLGADLKIALRSLILHAFRLIEHGMSRELQIWKRLV